MNFVVVFGLRSPLNILSTPYSTWTSRELVRECVKVQIHRKLKSDVADQLAPSANSALRDVAGTRFPRAVWSPETWPYMCGLGRRKKV